MVRDGCKGNKENFRRNLRNKIRRFFLVKEKVKVASKTALKAKFIAVFAEISRNFAYQGKFN